MAQFQVGYASVNINPPLGIGIQGYYVPRFAKGFLDVVAKPLIRRSHNGFKALGITAHRQIVHTGLM